MFSCVCVWFCSSSKADPCFSRWPPNPVQMHPSSDLFSTRGVRHRSLPHHNQLMGDFLPASSLSCPVTPLNSHLVASSQSDLLPYQTGSTYCNSPHWLFMLVYPEPIIIAAVARPSSDIKRLLNQHELDLVCNTLPDKMPVSYSSLPARIPYHFLSS